MASSLRILSKRPYGLLMPTSSAKATLLLPVSDRRLVHVGTKSETTPAPIQPSEAQAIPLGAYYEYVLNEPQPVDKQKHYEPPASAARDVEASKDSGKPKQST
ncbi:hypothetical protein MAPG_03424 [Magnaporthiopsis poae ATCC 64411]|uniref:Uncharacterized protein n=1 Tax=Magnaporthiopsis poae (strain ATCC 64411 / 73-15) TaxID=644358 RepID=A0A0C4DTZ3_MAGP6|nr:hypothetical protein MAPG_03424 [Magnaporthiopsis poae ATCC 64411]